jgi:hypothetical protein
MSRRRTNWGLRGHSSLLSLQVGRQAQGLSRSLSRSVWMGVEEQHAEGGRMTENRLGELHAAGQSSKGRLTHLKTGAVDEDGADNPGANTQTHARSLSHAPAFVVIRPRSPSDGRARNDPHAPREAYGTQCRTGSPRSTGHGFQATGQEDNWEKSMLMRSTEGTTSNPTPSPLPEKRNPTGERV